MKSRARASRLQRPRICVKSTRAAAVRYAIWIIWVMRERKREARRERAAVRAPWPAKRSGFSPRLVGPIARRRARTRLDNVHMSLISTMCCERAPRDERRPRWELPCLELGQRRLSDDRWTCPPRRQTRASHPERPSRERNRGARVHRRPAQGAPPLPQAGERTAVGVPRIVPD